MIHAYDDCRSANLDWNNCAHHACSELDTMAEDFLGDLEWYNEDVRVQADQVGWHEAAMRLKRRWLMDLPLSKSEQKRIDKLLPPNDMILPESFLRKDDGGYEDIRTCIEKAFGTPNSQEDPICDRDGVIVLNSSDGFQEVSFLLEAMTNKGLCSFASILTEGLDIFDKTNWGVMNTIKELLPKVIADKNDISRSKLKRCSLLLKDLTNFRCNMTMHFTAESYCVAAFKVLDELEHFPSRALYAMVRKLKGIKGHIPCPVIRRTYTRDHLAKVVRREFTKMVSNIGRVDEPPEELVGALGVASLTLKLIMNRPVIGDFGRFSPEMVALHKDIAKAIHVLNEPKDVVNSSKGFHSLLESRKVLMSKVQLLLAPKLNSFRVHMSIQNILFDYLYECSDMENIPGCLIESLDIINNRPQLGSSKKSSSKVLSSSKELMKEEIEKEVQLLLNISAQAKEVVANLLPEHEFDEEFARAYMEDFHGSDSRCVIYDDPQMEDDSQHFEFHSCSSYDQTESIGETNPEEFNLPVRRSKRNKCLPPSPNSQCLGKEFPPECKTEESKPACSDSTKVTTKPRMSFLSPSPARKSSHIEYKYEEATSCSPGTTKNGFSDIKVEETDFVDQQSKSVNGYLELQEACDATSIAAYHFVGYMLDTLANTEGIELYKDDRLYLRSRTPVLEDTEEFSDSVVSMFSEMWKNALEL
ncbi:uncharacterized protein LOC121743986 [Salvia splendens]|uniref:uncharacterized protein LOC121743986 n=1 Tax=Salvia splendens TaxID=180675 RepID=UPI001C259286|nr:uncharacterized protein LOC121743986 [Salvia splendens]XP_041993357.1 uncharacterized protein LOC121743986 [Salvia splendens]